MKKSQVVFERMQEAIKINLALLALKKVIVALRERQPHVPYQDDRLTMLLQPSLSGNGMTTVLLTGRVEAAHATETLQTLRFGEACSSVELSRKDWSTQTAVSALSTIDEQIAQIRKEIERKERWETRVVRRRDVRAGAGLEDGSTYRTDNAFEEFKVSGLVGAEKEHEALERLLAARAELVGDV
mmetsp:Transcript_20724/g.45050  ORF Transcript_20724/g.45050 Transcript_20724/m.45050 type:complete len:185 (-) Transcript_20724:42-596(-)